MDVNLYVIPSNLEILKIALQFCAGYIGIFMVHTSSRN